jgi:hypothetical protein
MGYAQVSTAQQDTAVAGRVALGLQKRAATRIAAVLDNEDQRERRVCVDLFNSPSAEWVTLVLLQLDSAGVNLAAASPTDAQIDTAVNTVWGRLVGLVS